MSNEPVEGWPIRPSVLAAQLKQLHDIVSVWHDRFHGDAYIEELDGYREDYRAQVLAQFVNEMKMVTSKAATIVELMS